MISIACQIYSSKKWALSFPYNGVVTINNDAKELTNSSLFDDFLKFSLQNSVISTVHAPVKGKDLPNHRTSTSGFPQTFRFLMTFSILVWITFKVRWHKKIH